MTRDWPVYSGPHTDEATVGQKGWRDYWNWQKGNAGNLGERGERQKAYMCGWLLYVVAESSG